MILDGKPQGAYRYVGFGVEYLEEVGPLGGETLRKQPVVLGAR